MGAFFAKLVDLNKESELDSGKGHDPADKGCGHRPIGEKHHSGTLGSMTAPQVIRVLAGQES